MRLLNTQSLQFKEFYDTKVPKYAILSHRWGDDELTHQDFRKGRKTNGQSYAKIKKCCALANNRGFLWVWIDTCCIDKKSSTEVSEAINSMYRWYHGAGECYAYLFDIIWNPQNVDASREGFKNSEWFTRGWTLQELLAPSTVIFLDREWQQFGTKKTLSSEISAATKIKPEHVINKASACVATKMSWLSRRETSRIEDLAYCMLGLFDVNMPLLYGEGAKSFVRLQLEIIKRSSDDSIFAWTQKTTKPLGMLATSPSAFADSSDITLQPSLHKKRFPYQMTNQGLELHAPFKDGLVFKGEQFDFKSPSLPFTLDCWRQDPKGSGPLSVTIMLARRGINWRRIECQSLRLSPPVMSSMSEALGRSGTKITALIYVEQQGL